MKTKHKRSKDGFNCASVRCNSSLPRKFIFFIIFAATLVVIIAVVCAFNFTPERRIESQVTSLATDYYESIYYENMLNSDHYNGDPATALGKFSASGLSPLTLNDLIILNSLDADSADFLLKYCDGDETTVRFFPDSPYSRTDYHVDYHYSCNF